MKKIINDLGSLIPEDIINKLNVSTFTHARNIDIYGTTAVAHVIHVLGPGEFAVVKDVVMAFDASGINLQNISFGIASLARGEWDTNPYPVDASVIFECSGFTGTPIVGGEIYTLSGMPADSKSGVLPAMLAGPAQIRFFIDNSDLDSANIKVSFRFNLLTEKIILSPNYKNAML